MSDIPIHPLLKNHAQNEHQNNNFHPVLVILTGFYVFSHVILWVTLCRIGVLSRVLWLKKGQNQGKSLIFTKIAISQNHSKDKSYSSRSARNVKFGQVVDKHRPKRC